MNQKSLQLALTRLSDCQIGLKEAAVLFALESKCLTAEDIADKCAMSIANVRARLGKMIEKDQIERITEKNQRARYFLTHTGARIIQKTLGIS